MLKWIIALALATAAPALSQAADFTVGEDVQASITIPDDWDAREYDGGVEADSPNGAYITYEAVAASDAVAAANQTIADLGKQGLSIAAESRKQLDGLKINGMDCSALSFDGTHEDAPAIVLMFLCSVDANNIAVLTNWTSNESDAKDGDAFQKILDSLKPAQQP